jgi:hypothetical protein
MAYLISLGVGSCWQGLWVSFFRDDVCLYHLNAEVSLSEAAS